MNALLRMHRATTRFDPLIADWGGALLLLFIRLFVGWQFFKAGMTKIQDWDTTVFLFTDEYSVPVLPPELAAWAGTLGELALPVLLFLGLLSRPAALGLFAVNAVAVFSYPALFEFECPAAVQDHFYWGALLLTIVAFGPGRAALDHWLAQRRP